VSEGGDAFLCEAESEVSAVDEKEGEEDDEEDDEANEEEEEEEEDREDIRTAVKEEGWLLIAGALRSSSICDNQMLVRSVSLSRLTLIFFSLN
jgi:hypothetical protein